MTKKNLLIAVFNFILFLGCIIFFLQCSVCIIWGPTKPNLMTGVQGGGSIACSAAGFEGLSCAVSFVDSPSEHNPLVVGWVSLVTHLREHAVPSLFPLNNVNGPCYVGGAAGGAETRNRCRTDRQKGSPMHTHTNTSTCRQTDRHTAVHYLSYRSF